MGPSVLLFTTTCVASIASFYASQPFIPQITAVVNTTITDICFVDPTSPSSQLARQILPDICTSTLDNTVAITWLCVAYISAIGLHAVLFNGMRTLGLAINWRIVECFSACMCATVLGAVGSLNMPLAFPFVCCLVPLHVAYPLLARPRTAINTVVALAIVAATSPLSIFAAIRLIAGQDLGALFASLLLNHLTFGTWLLPVMFSIHVPVHLLVLSRIVSGRQ